MDDDGTTLTTLTTAPPSDGEDGGDFEQRLRAAREAENWPEFLKILEELIPRLAAPLLSFAYAILGNREDAIDAVQEIWIKVARKPQNWIPGSATFETWLHRVLVNKCIDILRKPSRRLNDPQLEEDDSRLEKTGMVSGPSQLEDLLKREDHNILFKGLVLLDPFGRACLVLRYIEEKSEKEIAQGLGVTEATVHGRLHWARRHLLRIVIKLKSLEGVEWHCQRDRLSQLGETHTIAWDLFFRRSASLEEITRAVRRTLPETEAILREAFAQLETGLLHENL